MRRNSVKTNKTQWTGMLCSGMQNVSEVGVAWILTKGKRRWIEECGNFTKVIKILQAGKINMKAKYYRARQ